MTMGLRAFIRRLGRRFMGGRSRSTTVSPIRVEVEDAERTARTVEDVYRSLAEYRARTPDRPDPVG